MNAPGHTVILRRVLGALTAAALAGCAAMPEAAAPAAEAAGDARTELGDHRYEIAYRTPWQRTRGYGVAREAGERAMRDRAFDMALRQSALAALDAGYASFDVERRGPVDVTVEIDPVARFGGSVMLDHGFGRAPFRTAFGYPDPEYWNGYHYTRFPYLGRDHARIRADIRLVVRMFDTDEGRHDARSIARAGIEDTG